MEIRIASIEDWKILHAFYKSIYNMNHPLLNYNFWNWQYNHDLGKAIIVVKENEIIGHLGISISDGYSWHINLYIKNDYRNSSVILLLLKKANDFGKQANLSANKNAVDLYRSLKWYQYANLERRLVLNPQFQFEPVVSILRPINTDVIYKAPNGHFWKQPTLRSIEFDDGSTAIVQNDVGGLRFVTLNEVGKTTKQAFEMGFKWCDFLSSFNNPILRKLEKNNWKTEEEIQIPWLLNPVVYGNKSNLTFLSKEPIDINFYINRTHSDLGRVGSIVN
jgi:hypothetical protein